MHTSRLTSSAEVTIAIARSVELHREKFVSRSPFHSTAGKYPRRFVPERTHYESQDPKENNNEEKELDFPGTPSPHDQLEVDGIFLTDPQYTTRVKATDNSRGPILFRGNNDTRDPPMRPGEKPNDISKRTGLPLRCFRSNSRYRYVFSCPNASPADKVHFSQVMEPGSDHDSPEQEGVHCSYLTSTSTAHLCEASSGDVFLAKGSIYLGCCVDTGCLYEVIGKKQHDVFCEEGGLGGHPLRSSCRMFRFGYTTVQSLGVAVIYFYASTGKRISYESDVINLDVPALIGLSLLLASESDILLKEKKLVSPHLSVDLLFQARTSLH
jgi:hypothetical protein